ncbi:hypothetical protein [Saccharibacillus deserti]|uniref:hypothetical protein n=1 Tax=Saccharibacillus deserti TaxID=1634444 RepID=UPI001556360C|nr:hypothetical protein [Saccharibacillus deserti]
MDSTDAFYSIFHLTLPGLKVIAVLLIAIMLSGLTATFTKFRHNLTGPKILSLGITFIALAFLFATTFNFNHAMPSLQFIVLLAGITLCFIGVCWKK